MPAGFDPIGALRFADADGRRQANLDFGDDPQSNLIPALQIAAYNSPGALEGFMPNTTVGPYQAHFTDGDTSGPNLALLVEGFLINIYVDQDYGDLIDEAEMRRIAEALVVLPGAAEDDAVWTDQPLG